MGWMLRGLKEEGRPFVGRNAIRRELTEGTSRWASVGIVVDWEHWARLHRTAGLVPPKDEHPLPYASVLYDAPAGGQQVGYVTSFLYSPVLQRHVGLARVRPDLATPESKIHLEVALLHHNTTVAARTTAARGTVVLRPLGAFTSPISAPTIIRANEAAVSRRGSQVATFLPPRRIVAVSQSRFTSSNL